MSLQKKIVYPFLFILAFLMGGAHFVLLPWAIEEQLEERLISERRQLSLLAVALEPDIISLDLATIHLTLKELENNVPEWQHIMLTNNESIMLYPVELEQNVFAAIDDTSPVLLQNLYFDDTVIGYLKVKLNFSNVIRKIEERFIFIEILLFIIIGSVGLLNYLIQRFFVSKPLEALARSTRRISQGDYTQQYLQVKTRKDEIGDFVTAFNRMAVRLEKREKQLTEAAKQAEAASLAKSQFLAAMSHEIRTPLTGILGMADLLINSNLDMEQSSWASNIRGSGRILLTILNEILDQSKLEANKFELNPVEVDIIDFIKAIEQLYKPQAQEKGLTFQIHIARGLPSLVLLDDIRLQQILTNLLNNAVKFTEKGGITLTIGYSEVPFGKQETEIIHDKGRERQQKQQIFLSFSLKDTGVGIDESLLDHIFQPFSQADNSISRRYGGTGLGLSITYQLIALMGGDIQIKSELEKGTEITFGIITTVLSSVSQEERAQRIEQNNKQNLLPQNQLSDWQSKSSLVILVVDDVEVNRRLIQAIFKKLGHMVETAVDGYEAVQKCKEKTYDLILMDIRMPVMDGVEATSKIRALEKEKNKAQRQQTSHMTPIVAITADLDKHQIAKYLDAGFDQIATKPIDYNSLFSLVNNALSEDVLILHRNPVGEIDELGTVDSVLQAPQANQFDQMLEEVAGLLREGHVAETTQIEPELIDSLGDEVLLQEMEEHFNKMYAESCLYIKNRLSVLETEEKQDVRERVISELHMTFHSLKGNCKSFGHELAAELATRIDQYLKSVESYRDVNVKILHNASRLLNFLNDNKIIRAYSTAGKKILTFVKIFENQKL